MRAIAITDFGARPELMELPKPTPGAGDILVDLRAAGVNPVDWKIASGMLKDAVRHRLPLILGVDGAGVVTGVGEGVTRFRPGDHVHGRFQRLSWGLGSYAEYGLASERDAIAVMPPAMPFTLAAAAPTASMTAFNLVEAVRTGAGQHVLIVGATGGVGQSAVQLAADRGAHVIATARADATAVIKEMGAAETVDHRAGPVDKQVLTQHPDGVDAIIDLVSGSEALEELSHLVRPGGTVVSLGAVDEDKFAGRAIRGINVRNPPSADLLEQVDRLIEAGRLRIPIEAELPLEQAPDALERNKAGGARGKTVLEI